MDRGQAIALICLALIVLYTMHRQAVGTTAIVCPHCGDLVVLPRTSIAVCPSCRKLVFG